MGVRVCVCSLVFAAVFSAVPHAAECVDTLGRTVCVTEQLDDLFLDGSDVALSLFWSVLLLVDFGQPLMSSQEVAVWWMSFVGHVTC